ncbi:MAG: hypothetical protein WCK78_15295 [Paludibacter sp.]
MNQSLFPENKLVGFTKPFLALYVEDSYNPELNNFIQSNFNQIVEYYTAKEIDFCYLPYLLQNKKYKEIVNYNRPYLPKVVDENSITEIYNRIITQQIKPIKGGYLALFNENYGDKGALLCFPVAENKDIIEQFHKFANSIYEVFNDDQELNKSNEINFKILPGKPNKENAIDFDESIVKEESKPYDSGIRFRIVREKDADSEFDFEAYRLADEIRARIQQLKESGSLCLIDDIIQEIQGVSKQLSRVFITNDYRIFLKDYSMKEIGMSPLPKSLFILFLRHPEGILFKQLSDYHDELLSIYRNITIRENIDQAIESIKAMTDPLNNSINEKCSRIRAAFLEVIVDDLAQNYYVTGKRGEPKKIILDRNLVEFQK